MNENTYTLEGAAPPQDINATHMRSVSGGPESSVMTLLTCSWKYSPFSLRRMSSSVSHRLMTAIFRSSGLLETIKDRKPSCRRAAGNTDCRTMSSTRGTFSGATRAVVMRMCTALAHFPIECDDCIRPTVPLERFARTSAENEEGF